MFFSDSGADPDLKNLNGKLCPHPPLLFKACGSHLWVRALAKDERPEAETKLYMAPYWNCYDNGVCCTGSMKIPREKSVTSGKRHSSKVNSRTPPAFANTFDFAAASWRCGNRSRDKRPFQPSIS
jgi:PRTRC genetic system protein B